MLKTDRLILRPWDERDRDLFYEINSDPQVMEFFHFRRNRKESDEFFDTLMLRQIDKPTFSALELRATGECIGFCGLHASSVVPSIPGESIEIGWRLVTRAWGKGYATEAALAWLEHGFEERGLDEILSFAVRANRRSTAVMERIGMKPDPAHDFDHPAVPATHPHLRGHVLYRMTAQDWRDRRG